MKTCTKLGSWLVAVATLLLVASTGTSHAGLILSGGGLVLVEEGGTFDAGNLSAGGAAFATPSYPAPPTHTIDNLNDLTYGNSSSWIADGVNANGDAFAGITFGTTLTSVNSIAFGRDNLGGYSDRPLGLYTLQYTQVANPQDNLNLADNVNPALGWTDIGTLDYQSAGGTNFASPHLRHRYNLNAVSATAVRLVVPDSSGLTSGTCIDEIEVYDRTITYEANDPGTTDWFASTDPVSDDLAESATVTLVQGDQHGASGPLTNLTDGDGGIGGTGPLGGTFFTWSGVGQTTEVDKFKLSWGSNQGIAKVVTFSWQDYDDSDSRFPQIYTLYGSTADDPATDDGTLGGATWDLLATVDSTTVYPYHGGSNPPEPEQLAVTITGDGGGALGSYRHLLIRATFAGTDGASPFWSEFDVIALTFTSAQTGTWGNNITWGEGVGVAPGTGNPVVVQGGHEVTVDGAGDVGKSLSITGNSTVEVNGTLTIGEGVSVESGSTLNVDGTLTVTDPDEGVDIAGVLSGGGSVEANVEMGGWMQPGDSIGTLSIDGNLSVGSASRYDWEVGAGFTSDVVAVSDQLTLPVGGWLLKIIDDGGDGAAGDYKLFTYDSLVGDPSNVVYSIESDLAALGWTEDMLSVIDKGAGTGEDKGIFLHVVPEPNTLVLLATGLLALLLLARRRKR